LIDATYEPVNALNKRERAGVINRDYPLLRDDLGSGPIKIPFSSNM